jgi:GntR family transcriptional regulator/MocR family aminotransferase
MTSGEYDRHLRRTQRTFRARRDALVRALRDRLGGHAVIAGADAGAHVVVWLKKLTAAQLEQLIGACAARGVGVYSAATGPAVHASRSAGAGLLLGYGLVDVPEIERGVATIADAYRRVVRAGERLRT